MWIASLVVARLTMHIMLFVKKYTPKRDYLTTLLVRTCIIGSYIILLYLLHPKKLVLQCACLNCAKDALICIINLGHIIHKSATTLSWQCGIWPMLSTSTWTWNATKAEKGAARLKEKVFVEELHKAYSDSGAYLNKANIDEPSCITLFKSITVFYETDNIPQNIPHIQIGHGEYSKDIVNRICLNTPIERGSEARFGRGWQGWGKTCSTFSCLSGALLDLIGGFLG